jgi:hypothetical protein
VECDFSAIWCWLGYASKGEWFVAKLEGTIGNLSCFANLEVSSFVFNVVSLGRAERKEFWRSWEGFARDKEDDATIPVYMGKWPGIVCMSLFFFFFFFSFYTTRPLPVYNCPLSSSTSSIMPLPYWEKHHWSRRWGTKLTMTKQWHRFCRNFRNLDKTLNLGTTITWVMLPYHRKHIVPKKMLFQEQGHSTVFLGLTKSLPKMICLNMKASQICENKTTK